MQLPVIAVTTPFFIAAGTALALRLYVRVFLVKQVHAEEYLLIASFISGTSWWITKIVAQATGVEGDHVFRVVGWWSVCAWGASSALTKLSILCQYRRIFSLRWMRWTCNTLITFMIVYGLYAFFGGVFLCIPVPYSWGIGEGNCQNMEAFFYIVAAFNMTADVIIYALPVQPILALQVSKAVKIELLLLFTSGAFVIFSSAFRLFWCVRYLQEGTIYASEQDMIWCGIELFSTLLCACLPALRPVFKGVFPRLRTLFSTSIRRSNTYQQYPSDHPAHRQSAARRTHPKSLSSSSGRTPGSGQYKMQRLHSQEDLFQPGGTGHRVVITGNAEIPGSGALPDGPQHLVSLNQAQAEPWHGHMGPGYSDLEVVEEQRHDAGHAV